MLLCRRGGLGLRHLQFLTEGFGACGSVASTARGLGAAAAAAPGAAACSQALPSAAAASQQAEERRLVGWQLAFAALLGLGGAATVSRAEPTEQPPPDTDKV